MHCWKWELVFVYCNEGCAYATVCDVSAEDLDMLALVDLLRVGDDPNYQFVLRLDGCLGVEPRIGIALAEGLCDICGGGSLRIKASMIGCRRAAPLLIYILAFALQLRKSTENPQSV